MTDDEGRRYQSPQFLKANLSRAKKLNRSLSRKKLGSRNRERARIALAREYDRIKNMRRDYHFKLANDLLREYDILCFEDLNIEAMKKRYGVVKLAILVLPTS